MKQGSGSNVTSGSKVEPKATKIGIGAVARIGVKQIITQPTPLMQGRGYEAPKPHSQASHKGGSQGKY